MGVPKVGWAVYQRELRVRRKALGLCICCTAKAAPGRVVCQRHADIKRLADRVRRKGVAA